MHLKVYLPGDWDEPDVETLRALVDPSFELITGEEIPDPADYQVIVAGRPTKETLEASPNLDFLLIPFAGLPQVTADLLPEFPHLKVHNIHHNAFAAAEMAVTLGLACAKRIIEADRAFREGNWSIRYEPNGQALIDGSRVLVVGFGEIGRRVARVFEAMGASVRGMRRTATGEEETDGFPVLPVSRIHELLPETDILVLCLPLTDETHGLIGEKELDLMNSCAILVNVGRAQVVDEKALYEALRDRRLEAAGLDVWYRYPRSESDRTSTFPSEFPFWELPNVVMSPHRGGAFGVERLERKRIRHIAASLNALARDGEMPHRVDPDAGY
jgi:phosphoglycerate dehydrogenase-like enzyme